MKIYLDAAGKSLKKSVLIGVGAWDPKEDIFVVGKTLTVGLGKKEKYSLEKLRRAVMKLIAQARLQKAGELVIDLESFEGSLPIEDVAGAMSYVLRLSDYRFDRYKSKPAPVSVLSAVTLALKSSSHAAKVRIALRESEAVASGVFFTKNIANEPANVMTPPEMARQTKRMASRHGLTCRVLGKTEMKKLGMGGILGVSQGSSFPPQLIILQNKVRSNKAPIVLVGKGITFDTGGISIKPSHDMDKMKFDMCGAAAVIGTMKAIADLKLPVKVIAITPVCENMPGSKAQRPGDIIRCHNGKTVEVLNTDAEGRLILADALSYAKRFNPRVLIDIATLTGACSATFGDKAIGLMGTDEELIKRIRKAGDDTGERCWQLPLWEEYFELIKAPTADIQNISKKNAGTITAGMFLKEFADHTKCWAHLDIAGTAWTANGATGIGVRLLTRIVKSYL